MRRHIVVRQERQLIIILFEKFVQTWALQHSHDELLIRRTLKWDLTRIRFPVQTRHQILAPRGHKQHGSAGRSRRKTVVARHADLPYLVIVTRHSSQSLALAG